MNFKSQAQNIAAFLTKYEAIISEEVLDGYPRSFESYPAHWVTLLEELSFEEIYLLDSKKNVPRLMGSSLQAFIDEIKKLQELPSSSNLEIAKLEDWAWVDVKAKKKHEISVLAPLIKKMALAEDIKTVIDIGGGVGHLSRIIAHYFGLDCISLDREESFQKTGADRLKRYRQLPTSKSVTFSNINFGDESDNEKVAHIVNEHSLTLGLHTCGALANTVIKSTKDHKGKALLSFGCCYHKLLPSDFPISNFYRQNLALPLNVYALTLGTRAHGQTSLSDFEMKWRVKNYRAALHLFLYHRLNIKDCLHVGEMKNVKVYLNPFAYYIRLKLDQLNISHNFSDVEFNEFFNEEWVQKILKKMFLMSSIRWQLGRLIEVYLLLDRAIYLEENNYQVDMKTYFNEDISPRNIGIRAIKQKGPN